MQSEHLDRQSGRRLDGPGHRVRNVMQLEIEEDIEAHASHLAHAVRSAGGEHLQTDLRPIDTAAEPGEHGHEIARGRSVEDQDEFAGHAGTTNGLSRSPVE